MSLPTSGRHPLAPHNPTTRHDKGSHPSAFERFLTKVAAKQPPNTSSQRKDALQRVSNKFKVALPHLGDKLYSAVAAALPTHATRKASSSRHKPAMSKVNEPCYRWLLNHLYNPYPTREEWEALSKESKTSVKEVASWFMSARKRIGWSLLRANRFGRSQIGIVEAASRFWPVRDASNPLPPDLEVRFAEIEANANSLYSHILHPNTALLKKARHRAEWRAPTQTPESPANHIKKRSSADAELDSAGPSAKRQSLPRREAVPTPAEAPSRHSMASSSLTPSRSKRESKGPPSCAPPPACISCPPPTLHKFGEPSLCAKRPPPADVEEPSAKRPRTLPVWRDPRKCVSPSKPPQSRPRHPNQRLRASSTPSLAQDDSASSDNNANGFRSISLGDPPSFERYPTSLSTSTVTTAVAGAPALDATPVSLCHADDQPPTSPSVLPISLPQDPFPLSASDVITSDLIDISLLSSETCRTTVADADSTAAGTTSLPIPPNDDMAPLDAFEVDLQDQDQLRDWNLIDLDKQCGVDTPSYVDAETAYLSLDMYAGGNHCHTAQSGTTNFLEPTLWPWEITDSFPSSYPRTAMDGLRDFVGGLPMSGLSWGPAYVSPLM
ncbi:uncharacterized protein SCHCODRAFT_02684088 [Schizophyllum commune H4-8]|uniref:uncharacterized protein n=1 Tax=Schizophyllum commune (strain H4-8 / FGSC 9210) TaxID=578458 RepID=UPI00215E106D|nr:uncharacterized protein SCHCODRAFT_02684088 [Schizophyllum commune H4-8]KAI5897802.1 hypothetical protein SCHCODRAFT_02684088 [Schizophyllum commune H4-8]